MEADKKMEISKIHLSVITWSQISMPVEGAGGTLDAPSRDEDCARHVTGSPLVVIHFKLVHRSDMETENYRTFFVREAERITGSAVFIQKGKGNNAPGHAPRSKHPGHLSVREM